MYALILNYPPSLDIILGTITDNDAILQSLSFIKQLCYIFVRAQHLCFCYKLLFIIILYKRSESFGWCNHLHRDKYKITIGTLFTVKFLDIQNRIYICNIYCNILRL